MSDAEKNTDTQGLLDGRQSTYGNVVDNAARVASMWNGYLGIDTITAADMMMMMALYKAYRFKVTPEYSDNINDVLGYAEIVRQVQEQTGGLIHAETVKEFLAKKEQTGPRIVDRLLHDIGSQAQATFHLDYDPERKVRFPMTPALEDQLDTLPAQPNAFETFATESIRQTGNPYVNVERDAEAEAMDAFFRNRCGAPVEGSRCRLNVRHPGAHEPTP